MNTENEIGLEEESTKTNGSRSADKFVVRLPKGMRQLIAEVAKNYHRSMNSEIVSRLESSLRTERCLQTQDQEENAVSSDGTYSNTSTLSSNEVINTELSMQEFSMIEIIRKLDDKSQDALMVLLSNMKTIT